MNRPAYLARNSSMQDNLSARQCILHVAVHLLQRADHSLLAQLMLAHVLRLRRTQSESILFHETVSLPATLPVARCTLFARDL